MYKLNAWFVNDTKSTIQIYFSKPIYLFYMIELVPRQTIFELSLLISTLFFFEKKAFELVLFY
jgi:hypothetical protein